MFCPLFIKLYAIVGSSYLAATAGYITWRVRQKKRKTQPYR